MTSWQELYNDGHAALKSGKPEKAIDDMTAALHDLQQTQLLSILDARAQAYKGTSLYEQALDDAQQMMTIAPQAVDGYIRAASVYEAQRRFADAIGMYELGLLHANKGEGQTALTEHKRRAEQVQQRRVDWVSLLPVDVLALVMAHLSLRDCLACTQVSRHWRDTLDSCMYLKARHVKLTRSNAVRFLGRHVQSLELAQLNGSMLKHVGACSNLRTLVVYRCAITLDDLLPALVSAGQSLEQLAISIHPTYDLIALDPVLRACPKLTAFTFHAPHHTFSRHGSFPEFALPPHVGSTEDAPAYPQLEYLSWDVDHRIAPLSSMLQHFPRLCSLTIPYRLREHGGQQVELDMIVRDYCPGLEYLSVSHALLTESDAILPPASTSGSHTQYPQQQQRGRLREFRFGDLESYDGVDMVRLLRLREDDIETVRIGVHARAGHPLGRWNELPQLRCKQLRTLELTIQCETEELVGFLKHTGALEVLVLRNMAQLRNELLRALQQLPHLRRIAIYECFNFSAASMGHFLETTSAKLEHVTLVRCGGCMTSSTLERLGSAHGASLKSVHLAYDGQMRESGLLALVTSLKVAERVCINHMMALTDNVIDALSNIRSLRHVDITESVAVTGLSIRSLVDKNPRLRHLGLSECPLIGFSAIEYARHILGRTAVFDGY